MVEVDFIQNPYLNIFSFKYLNTNINNLKNNSKPTKQFSVKKMYSNVTFLH